MPPFFEYDSMGNMLTGYLNQLTNQIIDDTIVMYQYNPGENTTSYTYGIDNLRKTKTVNGVTTGFIWNGSDMVAETDGNIIKTIHRYSLSGIEQSLEIETFRYRDYIKNGHGDVTYININI